jgi:hypothetical protein
MTDRTDLHTIVAQANPVPDPSATARHLDMHRSLLAVIDERSEAVTHSTRESRRITGSPLPLWRRNAWAFAAAFALTLIVIGAMVVVVGRETTPVADEPVTQTTVPDTVPPTTAPPTTAPPTTTLATSANPAAELITQEFAVMEQQLIDPAVQRWMVVMQNPFRDKVFEDVRFEIDLLGTDGNVIDSTVRTSNFVLPEQEVVLAGTLSLEHEVVDASITSTAIAVDVEEGSVGSWSVIDVVYDSTATGAQGWGFNGNLTMDLEAVVIDTQVHVVMRDEAGRPVWVAVGQVPWISYLGAGSSTQPWTAPTRVEVEFDSFDTYVNPVGRP